MMKISLQIPTEDLDEAAIFFYRIWALAILNEHPESLVIYDPEYIVVSNQWCLHCCREPLTQENAKAVQRDVGKKVICACPNLHDSLQGLDVITGSYKGPQEFRSVAEALSRSARELPPAAKNRDPKQGRWVTKFYGTFELWIGRQARMICSDSKSGEFGYSWDPLRQERYFFRSKSCKRQGRKVGEGFFKLCERKLSGGKLFLNLDLLSADKQQAALVRLVPAGAGYKVFLRQLPNSYVVIPSFS